MFYIDEQHSKSLITFAIKNKRRLSFICDGKPEASVDPLILGYTLQGELTLLAHAPETGRFEFFLVNQLSHIALLSPVKTLSWPESRNAAFREIVCSAGDDRDKSIKKQA